MFATAEDLIDTVLSNPFNEGIILAGLEWTLQPMEMIELCKVANKNGLKIMIYTGCGLEEFYKRIGKSIIRYTGGDVPDDDLSVQTMVGRVALDYFVPDTYYIKTGTYDKDNKDDNYYSLGIKLSSKNQMVYEIKKSESDLDKYDVDVANEAHKEYVDSGCKKIPVSDFWRELDAEA